MGLSIHYRGRIRDFKKLPELIEEVMDIVKIREWKYTLFDESLHQKTSDKNNFDNFPFGLCFSPPECEPVFICFLTDGRMISPIQVEYFEVPSDDGTDECLTYTSVKTQYAGKEAHKTIINLFRHLNEKYLTNFSMIDESGYWETGNEKVMEKQFQRYNHILNSFESELLNNAMNADETHEDYITRIAQLVNSKNPEE